MFPMSLFSSSSKRLPNSVFARQQSAGLLPLFHLVGPPSCIRDFFRLSLRSAIVALFPQLLVDAFHGFFQLLHQTHVVRCLSGCGI